MFFYSEQIFNFINIHLRCFINMMKHEYGKHLVESKLEEIVTIIEGIKDGSTNLQVTKN